MSGINETNRAVKNHMANLALEPVQGARANIGLFQTIVIDGKPIGARFSTYEDSRSTPIDYTGNERDITTSNDTYMIVKTPNGQLSAKQHASLTLDPTNFSLADREGNKIQGLLLNPDGTVIARQANVKSDYTKLEDIIISPNTIDVQATANLGLGVNLPAVGAPQTIVQTQPVQVVDSLGIERTLAFEWKIINTANGQPLEYELTVTSPDTVGNAVTLPNAGPYVVRVIFDGQGRPFTFNGQQVPPVMTAPWNAAEQPSNIALNLGAPGTTQGITCLGPAFENKTAPSDDGKKAALYTDWEIDGSTVYAVYGNGKRTCVAEIPRAKFDNKDGLAPGEFNTRKITVSSGEPLIIDRANQNAGQLLTGAVRGNNIDVASEMTGTSDLVNKHGIDTSLIRVNQKMRAGEGDILRNA